MKAYVGTADGARLVDKPAPEAGPGTVLVQVRASALNRIDLVMATGHRHGASGGVDATLGGEWAGDVVDVGDGVSAYAPGDRVSGFGGGGFAELVAAAPAQLLKVADTMDYAKAVCFPVGLRTMYEALMMSGALQKGQSVLIQGASSGVGIIGMQLARLMGSTTVIGSSTTPERVARLSEWGADIAVNSREANWVEHTLTATDGKGVDLAVDQVSGALLNQTLLATRILGRIVNVGRLGGNLAPFDAETHALRRISLVGTTFRSRTSAELEVITAGVVEHAMPHIDAGRINMPVAETFEFADLADALDAMAANRHFGKIIIAH